MHMDALVAALLADRLDRRLEPPGRGPQVLGEDVVVHRPDPAEAAPAQRPPQHREDRPVVDDTVHEQDRRTRRLDVPDEQAAVR